MLNQYDSRAIYRLARDNQAQLVVAPTFEARMHLERTYFDRRFCDLPKGIIEGHSRAYDATGAWLLESRQVTHQLHRIVEDGAVCRLRAKENSVGEFKDFVLGFSFSSFEVLKK